MSGCSEQIVRRARELVGAPFRPQGRDPRTGLDCLGVVLNAFEISPSLTSRNYRLRGRDFGELEAELLRHFVRVGSQDAREADVLLCAVTPEQPHLALWCGRSFVHADARLRRVVETPGAPVWPMIAVFRGRQSQLQAS